MRENQLLLETVLENSAASIYAKRKYGRYTYLNHEMEALCNVVREQVLGKTDFEVVVWLRSLGLGKYEAAFRQNEIEDGVLPNLVVEIVR